MNALRNAGYQLQRISTHVKTIQSPLERSIKNVFAGVCRSVLKWHICPEADLVACKAQEAWLWCHAVEISRPDVYPSQTLRREASQSGLSPFSRKPNLSCTAGIFWLIESSLTEALAPCTAAEVLPLELCHRHLCLKLCVRICAIGRNW